MVRSKVKKNLGILFKMKCHAALQSILNFLHGLCAPSCFHRYCSLSLLVSIIVQGQSWLLLHEVRLTTSPKTFRFDNDLTI